MQLDFNSLEQSKHSMNNADESTLVKNKKRNTKVGTSGDINRAKLHIADTLTPHKCTYRIVLAIHTAYAKLFGKAHTLPDAYIIGFAKCGTTSLFEYLTEHNDVRSGFIKEVHYFDHASRYVRGINWYRSNFPLSIQRAIRTKLLHKKMIVVDATPRYINHPHAMHRIKKTTPNAKFIVVLRNPIERAYSHYNMNANVMRVVNEDLTFSEAIRQESQRISGEYEKMEQDESYYSTEYYGHGYGEGGLYSRWLKKWMNEFPNSILVLDNDSLRTDTQKTLDTVTDFLGLDRQKLRDLSRRNVGQYDNSQIDDETRAYLAEYYSKPNAELYSLLGHDLGWD